MRRSATSRLLDAASAAVTPVVKALLPEHGTEDQAEDDFPRLREESMDREPLSPKSPSGQLPGDAARFDTASYTPHAGLDYNDGLGGDDEIVTGHDKMEPGRLPAKVFRLATMLLVLLWAIGLMLPFGVFREFMTKPMMATIAVEDEVGDDMSEQVEAVLGTSPDGLPELIPVAVKKDLPWFDKGDVIATSWPHQSGFNPQSLSSSPSGREIVIADDIGVYVGHVETISLAGKATSSVTFQRVPPCPVLEGQHVQDISVTCLPDSQPCKVVVLHAEGSHIAECPLPTFQHAGFLTHTNSAATPATGSDSEEWQISTSWLHDDRTLPKTSETIKALATDSDCVNAEHGSGFQAESVGCVVVGTSEGRIVQLRGAFENAHRLVPERAMQQRTEALTRGSLHAFLGYVMVLRHNTKTVQAFDSNRGTSVGEWHLPKEPEWLTIGGGGGKLFLLAKVNGTLELHQFPLPTKLEDKSSKAASAQTSKGSDALQGPSLTDALSSLR